MTKLREMVYAYGYTYGGKVVDARSLEMDRIADVAEKVYGEDAIHEILEAAYYDSYYDSHIA